MKCSEHPDARLSFGPDKNGEMIYTCSQCGRRLDQPQKDSRQGTLMGWEEDAPREGHRK